MNVVITHLKAPWPAGAVVGSVVALPGPLMPAWAVGKCTQAPEGAEPKFTWSPPPPLEDPRAEFITNPAADADEKAKAAEAMLQAAEQEIAALQAGMSEASARLVEQGDRLTAALGERDALSDLLHELRQKAADVVRERDAARAQVEALTAALAEANGKAEQLAAALAEAQKPAADAPTADSAPAPVSKKAKT